MICYHISGNHLNRVWSGAYKKIAKLPEASHLATGQAGQSYDAFAEQIAKDLLDNEKQKYYRSFLKKLGFTIK